MKLQPLIVLVVVVVAAAVVVAACNKEAITTTPKIKIKSVSSDFVPLDADLSFTFEFSDKEGDLSQPIHVIKESSSCADAGFADSVSWAMPDIPGTKNTDGTLEIRIDGQVKLNRWRCVPPPGPGPGPDTLETAIFKFVLVDDAGNISDTAISQPITIVK
jgi:hypothetical protein